MSLYNDIERILVTKEQIKKRVCEIANELTQEYKDKNPLMICILKGSIMFYTDLIKEIDFPIELEFMCISSYGNSSNSSGEVKVVKDTDGSVNNRDVIIVEDIIDSGLTLTYLKGLFKTRGVKSLKVCALLSKPSRRKIEIEADYLGFSIEDKFAVGYGLDYAQKYRNMKDICVLKESIYTK